MRYWQQEQIEQILKSLKRIHKAIEQYIKAGRCEETMQLLTDCQESAISVGNSIEDTEGEDCPAVKRLEEYCEILYVISQEMMDSHNSKKAYRMLTEAMGNIQDSIKKDIAVKKEIAFFPYKASMWDSLESVYLAAREDENCDVYCVPIPYFDKNPDGSMGEMHYEGGEYPENIEITDWLSYDVEKRRPDVIYIHNPYDQWNFVTSVHPKFYAGNLKKYTDTLVYIPYFVLQETTVEKWRKKKQKFEFAFLPGTIYADWVVVQSENMRQIYMEAYRKEAKKQGLRGEHIDRRKLEEKFLGIGSPKFDKVQNIQKEDLDIPEEWLKIIEKPDGSRKKILLYNTSINGLLQHDEVMLHKIQQVLESFKTDQEKTVLWWRPHPLIETTVKAMRPRLWNMYQKIVEQYRLEGWGIYDDTADMDRAVVLSDAYYGDHSSVVQVYQKTGKPVMIQNVRISNS